MKTAQNKAAAPQQAAALSNTANPDYSKTQRSRAKFWTKRRRVLLYLAKDGNLNRFEAVSKLHDWVLPSTASDIQRLDGIEVARIYEQIRGFMGSTVTCARYRMISEEREKALNRLSSQMVAYGLAPTRTAALAELLK
ncbi:MAG TPA: hypothetical protein VKA67_00420 [Verrucomicrobiae bacterium]|nr:hypothetical protein [Verrucomicrobiae bacterium]